MSIFLILNNQTDHLPQCPFWYSYCTFPLYGRLLNEICPQTCAVNDNKKEKSGLSYSNLRMQNAFPVMINANKKRRKKR